MLALAASSASMISAENTGGDYRLIPEETSPATTPGRALPWRAAGRLGAKGAVPVRRSAAAEVGCKLEQQVVVGAARVDRLELLGTEHHALEDEHVGYSPLLE